MDRGRVQGGRTAERRDHLGNHRNRSFIENNFLPYWSSGGRCRSDRLYVYGIGHSDVLDSTFQCAKKDIRRH